MRGLPYILLVLAIAGCTGGLPPVAPSTAPPAAARVDSPAPSLATPPEGRFTFARPLPGPLPWRRVSSNRATASSGLPKLAVDGDRETEWNPRAFIAAGKPQWLALPVEPGAGGQRALVWHGHGMHYQKYDYGKPRSYEVQVSSDSTDGNDGTWKTVENVEENPVRSRITLFEAPGATWVRMRFLNAWDYNRAEPFLREVAVYAIDEQAPADVWLIMGDSVTSVALEPARPDYFAQAVTAAHPDYTPVLLSGGTGGDEAANAVERLDVALPTLPPGSVVGLCYGSNDAARGVTLEAYKARLGAAIDQIREAGHVPILAVVPWSLNGRIAEYAEVCRDLATEKGLPAGPDFYTYFKAHPEELETDKVHPNEVGIASMQRLWAKATAFRYPRD